MLNIKSLICMVIVVCLFTIVHSAPTAGNRSILKKRGVAKEVLDKLESEFKKLEASDSKSLLKKYLTKDVFDEITIQERTHEIVIEDLSHTLREDISQIDCGIYEPAIEGF